MHCPHANHTNCAIAARLAAAPVVDNRTDDACDHCARCRKPQTENSVTASLAVASLRGHAALALVGRLSHLLVPDQHPQPLVQLQAAPASGDNGKRLHISFHHGMGDYVHAAYLLQLYRRRGWDVVVCASQDRTSWLWEACGITRDCSNQPAVAHWGYPDGNSFWDNGSPEARGGHKVIDHVGVAPFPPIDEPKADLWRELCGLRIDVRPKLSPGACEEATRFLEGLPRPIVAYHGTGNSMREGKSIAPEVTLQVMRDLVQQDVSVVLLDWSAQDPIVSHPRCRGVKAAWGDIDLERMLALFARVDLVVGIDSGPLHAASLVRAKRLGIFPPDHMILPWRCVIPAPGDLHLIKRTLHWRPDEKDHHPGDLVPHAESRAATYPCIFYDPPLTAGPIVDAILQQIQTSDKSVAGAYTYERVGHDQREMVLLPGGQIGRGAAGLERRWSTPKPGEIAIHGESGKICTLTRDGEGWSGRWEKHERMPIRLMPVKPPKTMEELVCVHRGQRLGQLECGCQGKPVVYSCATQGRCMLHAQPKPCPLDLVLDAGGRERITDKLTVCVVCDGRGATMAERIAEAQAESRIGVCSLATDAMADVRAITRPALESYCRKHGYPLHYATESGTDRPASWGKVLLLQRHLAANDWLWWADGDLLVTDPTQRLEELTDAATGDLLIAEDSNGINCGSFLLRNCPWSVDFLRRVWETDGDVTHGWWEQRAVMQLLAESEADRAHVQIIPKRRINSYLGDWQPGDFALHAAGAGDKVRVLRERVTVAPDRDYVSPGLTDLRPDEHFPNMIVGDKAACGWQYLRREIPHLWRVDRRHPTIGFVSRDEAAILHATALQFAGKRALEIGCWMGWSTVHLAAGGVLLDVVDPALGDPQVRESVTASLRSARVLDRVQLMSGSSPDSVRALAGRWSLMFIDADHGGDHPLQDAQACAESAEDDAAILFHDLAAPDVVRAVQWLASRGWQVREYFTQQGMAVAWRGNVAPVEHVPDPGVSWPVCLDVAAAPV